MEQNIALTAQIVSAYVGRNPVASNDLPNFIRTVHTAINGLTAPDAEIAPNGDKPAVPVKKSITPDYIICLEDGKRLKMLKRYLRTNYDLTPEEYRRRWGLPSDYPMVAPSYAAVRSDFAKKIGLGRTASTPKRRASR